MDEQTPIGQLHDLLLPADLRIELCIVDLTATQDGRVLRFRIDPGRAYARNAYVRALGDSYSIGIYQRYLPGDKPVEIAGAHGLPLADVPNELRAASGHAYDLTAGKPHWREACPGRSPGWTKTHPGLTPAATLKATQTAKHQAATTGNVCYVAATDSGFACSDNPPDTEMFLSVTYQGQWSLHSGTCTYPVEGTPDVSAFFAMQNKTIFPVIRFAERPVRTGSDGARLSRINVTALHPSPAAYRGPGGHGPGNGKAP
jgi:hypothetical protein